MIIGLDHVQLAMPSGGEDEATRYYQDLLGMTRVPKPAHLAVRGGCWFEAGPVQLHVGVDDEFRPARKAHPALLVDDLAALVDRLAAAGFEPTPGQPLDGYLRMDAHDPFGNRIELLQRTSAPDPAA